MNHHPVLLGGRRFRSEPTALYRELRREYGAVAPVLLDADIPAWLVLGYRELHQVTGDAALFSRDSALWNQWERVPDGWPMLPMVARGHASVLHSSGEDHRVRAAVIGGALDAVDPFELRALAERYADGLIDALCAEGTADLVGQYAALLPVRVLAALFGFADEQGPGLVAALNDMVDGQAEAGAGQRHVAACMARLVADRAEGAERAERLVDDVAGRMVASGRTAPGPVLTHDQIAQDLIVMLVAGHQPTAGWIGNSLRLMLTDDRFAASLLGGRRSVAEAMNEVLWEDTPTQNVAGRWATRDTWLGGRAVRAGDLLLLGVQAANHDPQVRTYGTALTGGNSAHFSFGHGEHRCPFPAQEIAEVVARTALEVVLDRLPDLDLAVPPATLTRRPSPWLGTLTTLPVRFTPTAPRG